MTAVALKKQKIILDEEQIEIGLRLLTFDDRNNVRKWMADPYIIQLTFVVPGPGGLGALPFTSAQADQYLHLLISEPMRKTFAIEANGFHVGNIGIKGHNPERGTTEIFIEIGEERFRGRGIGKAAMSILMDYIFICLELDEVRLEVLEFNNIAIRTYEGLGFVRTHRSGWHYDPKGQYWQVWGMRLCRQTWHQKRKKAFLPPGIRTIALFKI